MAETILVGYGQDYTGATHKYIIKSETATGEYLIRPVSIITRPWDGSRYTAVGPSIIVSNLIDIHQEEV